MNCCIKPRNPVPSPSPPWRQRILGREDIIGGGNDHDDGGEAADDGGEAAGDGGEAASGGVL